MRNTVFQQIVLEGVGNMLSTVVCSERFDLLHTLIGSLDDVGFGELMTGADLSILEINLKVFE